MNLKPASLSVLAAVALVVAGCSGNQASAPAVTVAPTQTVTAPTTEDVAEAQAVASSALAASFPDPTLTSTRWDSPVGLGVEQTVVPGLSSTVENYGDPNSNPYQPDPGKAWKTAEVKSCNTGISDDIKISDLDWGLIAGDDFIGPDPLAHFANTYAFSDLYLDPNKCLDGWLLFQVPTSETVRAVGFSSLNYGETFVKLQWGVGGQ